VSERSKPGLEENFGELLNIYGPALSRLAASYTASASERDDLLQEIAIAIWQALPRFRGDAAAMVIYVAMSLGRPEPLAYVIAHALKVVGGPAGGYVSLGRRHSDSMTSPLRPGR